MPNRHLTRLFLRRFSENDVISPDADRLQFVAQAWGMLITGGLLVSFSLLIPFLDSPYPVMSNNPIDSFELRCSHQREFRDSRCSTGPSPLF